MDGDDGSGQRDLQDAFVHAYDVSGERRTADGRRPAAGAKDDEGRGRTGATRRDLFPSRRRGRGRGSRDEIILCDKRPDPLSRKLAPSLTPSTTAPSLYTDDLRLCLCPCVMCAMLPLLCVKMHVVRDHG